jgi:hypothetical protein
MATIMSKAERRERQEELHLLCKRIVADPHSADADTAAALKSATLRFLKSYGNLSEEEGLRRLFEDPGELSALLREAVAVLTDSPSRADDHGLDDDDDDEIIEKARSAHGGPHGLGAAVVEHMLDRLSSLRRRHGFEKTAKESHMLQDSLTKIAKDIGIIGVAKAIVSEQRNYGISEPEFVDLVTEHAKAAHPNLTGAQAFSKVYESEESVRRAVGVLKAAPFVTPLQVGGVDAMNEANDRTESSEAYAQLETMAARLRATSPWLSADQAFASVFENPANAPLAAKAHRRPRATTSLAFPSR